MAAQTERSYNIIKKRILDGTYKPSENLVEVNLAKEIGVSRNTIKKALLMLASEGLVDVSDNRGARVKALSVEDVVSYLQIREVLEGLICRLTAPVISDVELDKLNRILMEMKECKEQNNLTEYSKRNLEFHKTIYDACKNKQAVELTTSIRNLCRGYHVRTVLVPGRIDNSLNEHTGIFEALKARDPEGAEKLARLHIAHVRDVFVANHEFLI